MPESYVGTVRRTVQRLIERTGYEVRRLDSNRTLGEYVRVVLPGLGVNVVLDVGGHHGEYGQFLRAHGYRGPILSFEPQERAYRALQAVAQRDRHWRTVRTALGAASGTAALTIAEESSFSSFHPLNSYGREAYSMADGVATETVPVQRLDAILPDLLDGIREPRIFLKMDTQGFDLEVFRGATGCLGQIVALQSEMSAQGLYDGAPDFLEAIGEMRSAGFAVSGLFPMGRDSQARLQEFDCVMVRPGV
jgi:FkbM family methyltransferase